MSIFKILAVTILLIISWIAQLNSIAIAQSSDQNENVYKFHYYDREAKKIEAVEYALLRSAKYAKKKGFKYFAVVDTRHYDARKTNKSKFGRKIRADQSRQQS